MPAIWHDLRDACRNLRRAPAFTFAAIATLTLAIGGGIAVFAIVHGVMFSELAVDAPEELVSIGFDSVYAGPLNIFPLSIFREFAAQSEAAFAGVAGVTFMSANPLESGPRRSLGVMEVVMGDYFDVFRFRPVLGRGFGANEVILEDGTAPAVIGYGYWQTEWGGDPDVLGHTIQLTNIGPPLTVIGVMPADIRSYTSRATPTPTSIWIPVDPRDPRFGRPSYQVIARLRPGTAVSTAQAHVDAIAGHFEGTEAEGGFPVRPFQETIVGRHRQAIVLLAAGVGMVWLIGVLNLVSLQASRISKRERELAVRSAIGASRGRLIRSMTVEAALRRGGGRSRFLASMRCRTRPEAVSRPCCPAGMRSWSTATPSSLRRRLRCWPPGSSGFSRRCGRRGRM